MNNCTHRWLIESPEDARKRYMEMGKMHEPEEYLATCRLCGADREYPSSSTVEERFYDWQESDSLSTVLRGASRNRGK